MKPSRLISTLPDEAPSSWLVRLANANYLDVKEFCRVFHLSDLLKSALDINLNLSQYHFWNSEITLPTDIKTKIPSLEWTGRKSKWLIEPNKKGHAHWNTFSQICPVCLADFGYFRNGWKLQLFQGCARCCIELISACPKCDKTPSSLKCDLGSNPAKNFNPLFYCWGCHYDLRLVRSKALTVEAQVSQMKIEKAYSENPSNIRYLKFLQFGFVEEFTNQKSSKPWR